MPATSLKSSRQPPCNILAAAAHGVAQFIDRQGGQHDRVLWHVGIPDSELSDPNNTLRLDSYIAMMELAANDTHNDNFGLWFGQQFQPENLGLIGNIALTSPTLGSALTNLSRLFPYHQHATETRIVRKDNLLHLEYRVLDGRILQRRQDAELTMGMFANIFRRCLGQQWTPEAVLFEHPIPEAPGEHQRAFDAPIHFGQGTNALVFRDLYLDHRMPESDILKFTEHCNTLVGISGGTGEVSFLNKVKGEIRSSLPGGYPHISKVAENLQVPRWTLQRNLAKLGHSFSSLVEKVRQDLSVLYLSQPCLAITEVSYLLGYSEISAYSRAFTRWFGVSPQAYRIHMQTQRFRGG